MTLADNPFLAVHFHDVIFRQPKGLIYAAKAMAGAAIDMYEDPEIIAKAKAEMEEELDGDTYHCPIPDGCKPRALGMKM